MLHGGRGDPRGHAGRSKTARYVAPHDQELARRLRAAGLVVVGRTNTPELGILPTTEPAAYGPTRNPWDTARSTGGSSGGSAAAVASGMVPVGHANDGGGSIRIPASECGLVGLKPSRARVPLGPEWGDVMGGLVCELAVTRTVRDTAAVLDAVAGPAPGDPYAAPAPERPYVDEVGADARSPPHRDAERRLRRDRGHPPRLRGRHRRRRRDSRVARPRRRADPSWPRSTPRNSSKRSFSCGRRARPTTSTTTGPTGWAVPSPRTTSSPSPGRSPTRADRRARPTSSTPGRSCSGSRAGWPQWYEGGFDLLLTPTIAEPPPLLGEFDSPPDNPLHGLFRAAEVVPFTPAFNVTGQPAISLPLHWNAQGLPIGVQLVARYGREDVLLRVAAQLEEAVPWAARRPPVPRLGVERRPHQ